VSSIFIAIFAPRIEVSAYPPEFMRYEALPPHNVVWTITDAQLDSVFAWVHNGDD
jgi:hypothetical protein